ncbi:MAG: UDP-N-acetylmuramoyl-L-alanine--D-glutamate ligase [Bryobacteraceae bacterium]
MEFSGKKILIIGAKRSGAAAADLLVRQGAAVRVMDAQALTPQEQARFDALGVETVLQSEENVGEPDLIVPSPAVPLDLPLLAAARERGVPVLGEVEIASYFLKGPVIGITGSNGKTTTTALTAHLLQECGIDAQAGGNIGVPVSALAGSSREDQWNVLELSSFQLETIASFRAGIAACLNVTPDHLDRHGTFENYAAAKARLFETQQPTDFAVLNYEDETCRSFESHTPGRVFWFSSARIPPLGVWMNESNLFFNTRPFMQRSQVKLRGIHNLENVMAAALMAHLAGAKLEAIGAAVASFPGVEHRIEYVRTVEDVAYYNDSKATNVDATLKAIDAFPGRLWIILGGKDKGSDYTPLRERLEQRARAALLIGAEPPYPYAAAPRIRKALEGALPVLDCRTLDAAVRYAREHAQAGDVVLLAPACASFDQFENYEQRGDTFKHLVAELS